MFFDSVFLEFLGLLGVFVFWVFVQEDFVSVLLGLFRFCFSFCIGCLLRLMLLFVDVVVAVLEREREIEDEF